MKNFFSPQSIAVIGASKNPEKLGHQILKNLISGGYKGRIFPINLDEKEILKLKTYSSVLDIHSKIDLAVIIVPREIVPNVLSQCVHKEIPFALIITAGFAEKDDVGKDLQSEIIKITKNSKTKIIGPNCLGIVDTENNMNLTFAASDILPGKIGLILQSGAIGSAIFDWSKQNNIGFSKFISLGNKVSINEEDALQIMADDFNTKVIALYLEDISNPQNLLKLLRAIAKKKPIIVLKGGTTPEGSYAATSHTGAINSSHELSSALFEQANLIVSENYDELINYFEAFQSNSFLVNNNNVGIISNAGGPAILAVDAVQKYELNNLEFPIKIKNLLKKQVANSASINNPIDLGGDATSFDYKKALDIITKSKIYGSLIIIITPQTMTDLENIADLISGYSDSDLLICCAFMGGQKIQKAEEILRKKHVPVFNDPEIAAKVIGRLYRYSKKLNSPNHFNLLEINKQTNLLDEKELIYKYNLNYAKFYNVSTDAEVMGHIEDIGFPAVYKAPKTKGRGKAGRVGLNLRDHNALEEAVKAIGLPGVIQEMIESPFEIIIGAKRDLKYGISLLFGQGGIFVEEFDDISLRLWPLTEDDLNEMIEQTKVFKNIEKFQVKELLKSFILKVAKIMLENDDISEIEFNPIKVLDKKIVAVDINIKRM